MNLIIPTDQALDRLLEMFLGSLNIHDPIINEELVYKAFYEGAKGMYIITELQCLENEEEIGGLIDDGVATIDEVNAVLSEATFEEANFMEGDC